MPIFMQYEGIRGAAAAPDRFVFPKESRVDDDVIVDGRIITAEDWSSATTEGGTHEVGHLRGLHHGGTAAKADAMLAAPDPVSDGDPGVAHPHVSDFDLI